jgi:hypothetical protein
VEKVEYCSGVLSQKLTGVSRVMEKHFPHLMVWALLLPLRWIPPVFDKLATGFARWPGYSITLVARKRRSVTSESADSASGIPATV